MSPSGSRDEPRRDGKNPRSGDGNPRSSGGGDRKPYRGGSERRDDARPARDDARPARDGTRKPWAKDGARPARDGERKPWAKDGARPARDGERKPWAKDGARSDRPRRDSGPHEQRLWTRGGAPARGDREAHALEEEMTEEQRMQRELRAVRPRHDDPELPEDVTANDLDRVARNELKTLTKDNAEAVGRHMAMAARLIEEDPALAHRHAMSAARRAGRIAVVRETLAITAYATEDFALALRELRTYRRISGSNDQLALMVDSERGVGRPDRALELGRSVDRATLPAAEQVAVAIAMSGARLDLGQADAALSELEIPQLDSTRAYSYSPELFSAYAEVLGELGRVEDAQRWSELAARADAALHGSGDDDDTIEIIDLEEDDDVPSED